MNRSTIQTGLKHLSDHDPRFDDLIKKYGHPTFKKPPPHFQALAKSIIFQQLAGKAANTIYNRFLALFNSAQEFTPENTVRFSIESLRSVGLSLRKSEYILDLSSAFLDDNFLPGDLSSLSNEEISNKLISIRGIGQWTADMFLMFTLQRQDVMPINDLGIQNGLRIFFNLEENPTPDKIKQLTNGWKPYRTLGAWYMWEIVDDGFTWE